MSLQPLLDDADRIGAELRQLNIRFRRLHQPGPVAAAEISREARVRRTEQGFALLGCCRSHLEELRCHALNRQTLALRRRLQGYARLAHRLNRESPVPYGTDLPAIPIGEFKNFQRDAWEHMYFLALHPFPSAFDFYCTTYVETPRGYRQELHLHRYSAELTLVLEGEADCVWYQSEPDAAPVEAGRVTARAGEACRIPPGVVHAIDNPQRDNRNISVKLTMFIDDRLGQQEPAFQRTRGRLHPVTCDPGVCQETPWGTTTRFQHEYRSLCFQYRLDTIHPRATMPGLPPDSLAFLYDGSLQPETGFAPVTSRRVLLNAPGGWTNTSDHAARLFSVEGLDHRDFLQHAASYPQFPAWCRKPLIP